MDKKKNGIPKLRFPGFTDPWEQHKFGDVVDVNPKTKVPNEFRYVDLESVQGTELVSFTNETRKTAPSRAQRFAKKGDVFYQTVRPYQKNNYLFELNGDYVFSSGYAQLRSTLDGNFLMAYVQKDRFVKDVLSRCTGTSYPAISPSDLREIDIKIPSSINESNKIGKLFNNIDSLITLHQRELDHLKEQKTGLLQKMFPKNGETIPEVRFPGFTDAWEQHKLGDLASMHARIGWQNLRTTEFLEKGKYMLVTGTDFENGQIDFSKVHFVTKKRYDQDKNIQIEVDSILITKDGTLGKVAFVNKLFMPATLNAGIFNVVVKDKKKTYPRYLFHYLKAPYLLKYANAQSTGGTIKHLNQKILLKFPIPMTSLVEQKKISGFLDKLDSLITLHQRKLDHLKLLKKGLLQQMFV